MISISVSPDKLRTMLADHPGLSLAAINSESLCVVSGTAEHIHAFQTTLTAEAIQNKLLHTSHAFHSASMDAILDPFIEEIKKVTINSPAIPFLSNLTGDWADA